MDRAALIGCGVTTGIGAVIHTASVEPGSTVAVIGCGGIGLSAINGAALAGASRIIAVDMVASKLELARKFGATDLVDASDGEAIENVRELTGGGRKERETASDRDLSSSGAICPLQPRDASRQSSAAAQGPQSLGAVRYV